MLDKRVLWAHTFQHYMSGAQTVHRAVILFAVLVAWSREMLNMLLEFFRGLAPDLASRTDVSLAGDLAPKAFLLLVLGLFASGVIRFFAWMVRRLARSDDY